MIRMTYYDLLACNFDCSQMSSNPQAKQSRFFDTITLLQRKHYGCLTRIFCCKCFHCCQDFDFSLLTSQKRKGTFHKMVTRYVKNIRSGEGGVIMDPFFMLLALLLGEESQTYTQLMSIVSNQNESAIFSKQDLQFYIPELCTYLVFHEELANLELERLLMRACKIDMHFSLKYFFYMTALEVVNVDAYEERRYGKVQGYNVGFRSIIGRHFGGKIVDDQNKENMESQSAANIYLPVLSPASTFSQSYFQSSVNFFKDLLYSAGYLLTIAPAGRQATLCVHLKQVNSSLPGYVLIPLTKYQQMQVMNIVVEECRVFNTKERAPVYLCIEAVADSRKAADKQNSQDRKVWKINRNHSAKLRKSLLFEQDQQDEATEGEQTEGAEEDLRSSTLSNSSNKQSKQLDPEKKGKQKGWSQFFKLTSSVKSKLSFLQQTSEIGEEQSENHEEADSKKEKSQISLEVGLNEDKKLLDEIFGESEAEQLKRIQKDSKYSQLPGYRLLHLILKINDDLRQENFAMQLLQEFATIFRMEKLPINLLPYEVLPLSHNSGLIECVKDAVTIDELRKKGGSITFVNKNKKTLSNFIHSLVGYSVISYLLQVKDRHNGNIMIRRDGSLFHIDFGFFMSNVPGKGVQLQRKLPFKLTNEYVEAMGGVKSKDFSQFRRLFYMAYNACRKHQHRILILAKLMYCSYGKTMPCFSLGDEAITQLEQRFNPRVSTDAQMSVYCMGLIDRSMDSWRMRWYDKWQYYMQGIVY